jgi:hypothetical protein
LRFAVAVNKKAIAHIRVRAETLQGVDSQILQSGDLGRLAADAKGGATLRKQNVRTSPQTAGAIASTHIPFRQPAEAGKKRQYA